ncbi:hypothetical protein EC957_005480 [Mortierella hygrophila]|uniref:Uncharacterized protein n=1 Tax=Mortierella hygrophila TaxID=979708 RepID=A0A9P6K6N5_9FUNG|nr:hypothetical protein EC957_005480 [Mortierella hygrophila]
MKPKNRNGSKKSAAHANTSKQQQQLQQQNIVESQQKDLPRPTPDLPSKPETPQEIAAATRPRPEPTSTTITRSTASGQLSSASPSLKGKQQQDSPQATKLYGESNLTRPTTSTSTTSDYPQPERRMAPATSMETEYIEALYAEHSQPLAISLSQTHDSLFSHLAQFGDLPPNSSSESGDIDFDDIDSYDEQGVDGDCEDFEDDLDVYEHDDFLSSQEAILLELRREQVEFEENVRQLQQQLQRQGSLLPSSSSYDGIDYEHADQPDTNSGAVCEQINTIDTSNSLSKARKEQLWTGHDCRLCVEPRSNLCIGKYGWYWRPIIIEALATAAAAIAIFNSRPMDSTQGSALQQPYRFSEFLPRPNSIRSQSLQEVQSQLSDPDRTYPARMPFFNSVSAVSTPKRQHPTAQSVPISHMYRGTTPPPPAMVYPLPPNSPYKFGRKSSEFLEPVGETHEFQSAEGNSRQVLLHVWPPDELDTNLLQKLEACCREFQSKDVVRGHSGDGFLNGWRPSWRNPQQTGVLRFGHWRVRAPPEQGGHLYPPFQTPLTLAAGGGSVLGSIANVNANNNTNNTANHQQNVNAAPIKDALAQNGKGGTQATSNGQTNQTNGACAAHDPPRQRAIENHRDICHDPDCPHRDDKQQQQDDNRPRDLQLESATQGRLLRLVRAIQMVEKGIIARHLKFLFPTLYEKYHGLQFGTPRLFDAVATVALAMDVSPRLHHDKAHTKHGFCWIVACGDFVGGDLCIPELGKRVVMRPGTVVAIRSTVVAYYIERYAKDTSMYVMYAYTSDNNWPPAA